MNVPTCPMPAINRKVAKAGYISAEAGKSAQAVPLTAKNKQLIAATKKRNNIISVLKIHHILVMGGRVPENWVFVNPKPDLSQTQQYSGIRTWRGAR